MKSKTIQQQIERLKEEITAILNPNTHEDESLSDRLADHLRINSETLCILTSLNERIEEHEKSINNVVDELDKRMLEKVIRDSQSQSKSDDVTLSKSKRFNLDKDVRECKEDHTLSQCYFYPREYGIVADDSKYCGNCGTKLKGDKS